MYTVSRIVGSEVTRYSGVEYFTQAYNIVVIL